MLTISTAMQIQEVIHLPVPTLPTDTSDSDTSMMEEAETCSLKSLVLLPEGTSCVKRTEEIEFHFVWLGFLIFHLSL